MKFKVTLSSLRKSLKVVSKTIEKNSGISSHYIFTQNEGKLSVQSHMEKRPIFSKAPLDVEELEGVKGFTIEGQRLDLMLETLGEEVLDFDFDGQRTTIKSSRGSLQFPSLSPYDAPSWEEALGNVSQRLEILSDPLRSAFSYVKDFAYEDQVQASTSIAQFREGSLWVTDRVTVARVKLPGLEGIETSLHVKDLSSFAEFLKNFQGSKVDLHVHPKLFVLESKDGSYMGAVKPDGVFPDLSMSGSGENPHLNIKVSCEETRTAIQYLSAGSFGEGSNKVVLREHNNVLKLSMPSTLGKPTEVEVPISEKNLTEGKRDPLDEEGFFVSSTYLLKVLSHYRGGKDIYIGANEWPMPEGSPRAGWLSFLEKRDGGTYQTILTRTYP